MPIRRSPNDARYPRPQPGRDPPEQVVAINRNAWSQSIGTDGRDHPVRALRRAPDHEAGDEDGNDSVNERHLGSRRLPAKHALQHHADERPHASNWREAVKHGIHTAGREGSGDAGK